MRTTSQRFLGRLSRRKHAKGAQLIEFALTLPVVLILIYLIIAYSIVFLLQQTLSFAASEGARAGLAYPVSGTTRSGNANTRITQVLSALPTTYRNAMPAVSITENGPATDCGTTLTTSSGFKCLTVRLSYPFKSTPGIILPPGMSSMMPDTLSAKATALYEN